MPPAEMERKVPDVPDLPGTMKKSEPASLESLTEDSPKEPSVAFQESRSLKEVLAENEKLKEDLDVTKQCWDIDRNVLERKIKSLEEKLKESELRAANLHIEAHNYEQQYKLAREQIKLSGPLVQVGAAVRHHFLGGSARTKAAVNAASKEPNAKADLALYNCGFLDANNATDAKMFTKLYKMNVRDATEQRLYESDSQVQLFHLRATLQTTPKSSLGKNIPFFDPQPYVNAFWKLDIEISLLRPKMDEDGKSMFQDAETPVEDPRVWEKLEEAKRILGILGVNFST